MPVNDAFVSEWGEPILDVTAITVSMTLVAVILFRIARRRFAFWHVIITLAIGALLGMLSGATWLSWVTYAHNPSDLIWLWQHWDDSFFLPRCRGLAICAIVGMFASWLSLEIFGQRLLRTAATPADPERSISPRIGPTPPE